MSTPNSQNNISENSQTPRAVPSASDINFSQLQFSEPNSITNTLTITIPQPTFVFGSNSNEPVSPFYSSSIPSPISTPTTPVTEEIMASPSETPIEPIHLATPQQIEFTDSDVEMIEEATTEEVENESETDDDEMPELLNGSLIADEQFPLAPSEDEESEDDPFIPEEEEKEEEATENKRESYECGICYKNLTMDTNVVTKCDHHFCKKCFYRWIQTNANCPMCRTQIACEVQLTDEQLDKVTSDEYGKYVWALERATRTESKLRELQSTTKQLLDRQVSLRVQVDLTQARTNGIIFAREKHFNQFNPKTEKMRKFYRSSYSPGLYGEFMKGYYYEKVRIENFTTYTNPINFGISNRKRKNSEKSNIKIKKRNKEIKIPEFDFVSADGTGIEIKNTIPPTVDMTREEPTDTQVFVFGELSSTSL